MLSYSRLKSLVQKDVQDLLTNCKGCFLSREPGVNPGRTRRCEQGQNPRPISGWLENQPGFC